MKYKVGDRVRIRKDLKIGVYYDGCLFAPKMQNLCGKTAYITEVVKHCGVYHIDSSTEYWTDEMFDDQLNREASEPSDAIKPDYYQFHGYDVFDIAEHFGLSFPLGNALKYLLRCKHKENEEQDLRKAIKCIERHLEMMGGKDNV